jgi:hypothetical protein
VSNPVVLHVSRPYADEAEYLEREAWSIDAKSMLLIGEDSLPIDTPIVFDVVLEDGNRPIRAEARVLGPIKPHDGRPGGLRVRFRRFGSVTKAFIERAVAMHPGPPVQSQAPGVRSQAPGPVVHSQAPGPAVHSQAPAAATQSQAPSGAVHAPTRAPAPPPSSPTASMQRPSLMSSPSGVHKKPVLPVPAPVNRAELLERLRERRRLGTRAAQG